MEELQREHDFAAPRLLPANADAWSAFQRVRGLRHRDWGIAYAPDWTSIATVLRLHSLWTGDVQDKLEHCFYVLTLVEAEDFDQRKQAQQQAAELRKTHG